MPRNGSGTYTLPEAAFIPGTTISSSAVNDDFSDIATALTQSLAADGQTPITAPLKGPSGILSAPSWTFNADTTAGIYLPSVGKVGLVAGSIGVVVNSVGATVTAASPAASGANYAVGDTITLTGGTVVRNALLTVATLSGSGVASVTVTDGGLYTTAPSNPASQGSSSGSGTGATFTLTTATSSLLSTATGTALWTLLGATSYMAGAMAQVNALALANYIGAANLAAAIQTSLPIPPSEGYLTPVSGTPIITSDSTGATTIFYSQYTGTWVPIHNGTAIIPYQFSQMALNLTAAQGANGIFDVFLAYNSGTPVIGTGPSWSAGVGGSVTPGSCARGTGVSGTAISRSSTYGLNVNTAQLTLTYNNGTISGSLTVAAGQAIYLGTIYIDATAGQVTCHRSTGQNRKWGIWNAFNRSNINLLEVDPTVSWGYSGGIRALNGAPAAFSNTVFNVGSGTAANGNTVLCGLAEEEIVSDFVITLTGSPPAGQFQNQFGIGLNSNTAYSGIHVVNQVQGGGANPDTRQPRSTLTLTPTLGINILTINEDNATAASWVVNGTTANMQFSARYRG